jgi:hypothetical protein
MTSETIKLETALYSNSQKQVTWRNDATVYGTTGWIINMILPDAKRLMATEVALQKAFETLPDISTKTR